MLGIPVISGQKLKEIYSSEMDIIVCAKEYFCISAQLIEMGITDYYVLMEGFLYHSSANETMMPVELNEYPYLRKETDEKNVLYIQNTGCSQSWEAAAMMKSEGYKIYLLYVMAFPETNSSSFMDIYDRTFTFYTADGIVNFIENSEFDVIHSSNDSDILTNIALSVSKHVALDMSNSGCDGCGTVEKIILSYIANMQSAGMIYKSLDDIKHMKKKYELEGKEILCLEESGWNSKVIADFYEKVKKRNVT